ncbi:MAG: hypothetical protein HFI38_13235 [Lachnospiraceae bacterium]|jgi:methionyl-tRNA formyltransferase|nr:hypothetical protein [Lachnospiraceae bacterium]
MDNKLRVVVMTQNDRFFIPKNIKKASEVCDILEIVEVDSKYSLDNQVGNYFKWFGLFQCAKMGFVTIGRECEKYLDRISGYKIMHGYCSVKDVAKANGIPHRVITKSNDPEYVKHIKDLNVDLIVSYSAPQIIKEELLNTPKYGIINVHGSLLPDFRGCLPSFWYLYCDERKGGATVHYMSALIDDGDIIEQGEVDLSDCKSMFQVMKKTKLLGGNLMVKAIQDIQNGTAVRKKNETDKGRYFTWPTVEQAREFRAKGKKLI